MSIKYPHLLEDFPYEESWVICKRVAVHHEGDERSRTAPGHGYPARTDYYLQVEQLFDNEKEFIERMEYYAKDTAIRGPVNVRGFKLVPYMVTSQVEITVEKK